MMRSPTQQSCALSEPSTTSVTMHRAYTYLYKLHSYDCKGSRLLLSQSKLMASAMCEAGIKRRVLGICRADTHISGNESSFDLSKYANKAYLDKAARRFQVGLESGLNEDELLLKELGAEPEAGLTDIQMTYKDKVKEKLLTRAEELRVEEEQLRMRIARNIELGKKAYEYGQYPEAVKFLEDGVNEAGRNSNFGGEGQLWLALAYQAVGREQDCIDVYKYVEATHPSPRIRKQAADLRYIMEAPKIPLGEDETVKIPLLNSDTWRSSERKSYSKLNSGKPIKESSYWDRASFDKPPVIPVPDEGYIRVLAISVGIAFVVVCGYLNVQYAANGGRL